MTNKSGYDVFLCYAREDFGLADRLNEILTLRGLSVFQDVTGIHDFADISQEIRSALMRSRAVVVLYTPDLPRSPYCRWEIYTALTRAYHLDGHTERVMAVPYGVACDELRPRRLARLRTPAPNTTMGQLADSVIAKLSTLDLRPLGAAPQQPEPTWYPHPTARADFYGRQAELWDIHDALFAADNATRPAPPVVRVTGPPGQGKSALVEHYARVFAQDHPGGIFVLRGLSNRQSGPHSPCSCRLRATRDELVADIADRLGLVPRNTTVAAIEGALCDHLSAAGLPYLWIVDDAPSGADSQTLSTLVAPTPNGRTLVTTRADLEQLGGAEVRLAGLDETAALRLLTSRREPHTGREWRAARDVANDLGGHPQALVTAAHAVCQPSIGGFVGLRAAIASIQMLYHFTVPPAPWS